MNTMQVIPGKNYAPENLGRVLVLGLGKSGSAAVRYLSNLVGTRVSEVFVAAGKESESSLAFAKEYTSEHVSFAFDCESFDQKFDLCISSPGISEFSDFYQNAKAASAEVISETEFAWRESDADSTWICVTGTNGKTTTTSLVAHILKQAGLAAAAVGNIGDVCLDAVATAKVTHYVAECSSYQLASTKYFSPQASIILNITPDHLKWHHGFEAYEQAKYKALENLSKHENAIAVLDATDACLQAKISEIASQENPGFAYIPLGSANGLHESMCECGDAPAAAYCSNGVLKLDYLGKMHEFGLFESMNIKGTHNLANTLAAVACTSALGIADEIIAEAIHSFMPLEHRIEPCGSVDGVAFFNDSKGTNVDATLKAYTAFEPGSLIVLLGGRDKFTDLSELVAESVRYAYAVVLYGESRERFAQAFDQEKDKLTVIEATGMKDAFDAACEIAQAGHNILLSPACASFDEFSCFEERGEVFKAYAAEYCKHRS